MTDTMRAARRYRKSSSFSSQRMAADSFMAPTALMDSGHRSRNSKTNGTRFSAPTAQPATAVKNCGEVATTMSTRRTKSAARKAMTM